MFAVHFLLAEFRRRCQALRATGDAGYTTETVIGIALLAALAIGVLAIIAAKLTGKASSIDLG